MNTKKNKIIFISIILGLVFLAMLLSTSRKEKKSSQIQLPPANPLISSPYSEKLPISSEVEKENFNFPSKLSGITIKSQSLTEEQSKQIASKFDYNYEPEIFNGKIKGKTLIWRNLDNYLSVSLNSGKVEFTQNNPIKIVGERLNEEQILTTASKFLEKNLKEISTNYKIAKVEYLEIPKGEGTIKTVDREKSNIIRVRLDPIKSQLELISLYSSLSTSFLDFLPNGEMFRFEISNIEPSVNTQIEYSIKNFEDFNSTIDSAKLIYFYSDSEEILEFPQLNKIGSIVINKIKLAYLIDNPIADFYKPVFVLEGPAKIGGFPDDTVAHLYMPAFK